jgi:PEP-CTERM motif
MHKKMSASVILLMTSIQANALVISQSGSISPSNSIEDFNFTIGMAGNYSITTDSDGDTEINLFRDDGHLDLVDFLANDDDGQGVLFGGSAINMFLDAGSYLLRASEHDFGNDDGTDIEVIGSENDQIDQSFDFTLNIEGENPLFDSLITDTGSISSTSSIDDFFFSVGTAGMYSIFTESIGDAEINLFVDDGDLDLSDFLENDDDGSGVLFGDSFIRRYLDAGDYRVRVSEFNFGDDNGTDPEIIGLANDDISQNFDFSFSILGADAAFGDAVTVSEPETLSLLAMGLMGLCVTRRKLGINRD